MIRYLTKINGGQALIYVFVIIVFAMIITVITSSKIPKLSQDKKKYIIYILSQSLIFLIFGAILFNLKNLTITNIFHAFQVYFLVAGSIHLISYVQYFKKFENDKIFFEILISFLSSFYVSAFVSIIVGYYNEFNYIFYLFSTLIFFSIPTFCYILFEKSVSIPAKLHKRWFYPLNSKYPSPQASEMRNIIILNLVFQKKENENQIINFKVKAPKAFDFGRLFFYFINDYNDKNPNSKINFLDDKEQPFGWYFYTKPKWFGSSEYIDPDLGIDTNNIKDGETIICQRI